ncbi:MAG: phage GP46 family protein [bacterium]|nr:phage GP46 family protein [bacterium]
MLGGDIKILWNEDKLHGDFILDDGEADIASDGGLETAVIVSLFTDRRAGGEELPPGETALRGWWGDSIAALPEDKTGSKLWLLFREKDVSSVASRAKEYAEAALRWMLDDKIVKTLSVSAEMRQDGALRLSIDMQRPDGRSTQHRYNLNWRVQEVMH